MSKPTERYTEEQILRICDKILDYFFITPYYAEQIIWHNKMQFTPSRDARNVDKLIDRQIIRSSLYLLDRNNEYYIDREYIDRRIRDRRNVSSNDRRNESSNDRRNEERSSKKELRSNTKNALVIGAYTPSRQNESKWLVIDFDASQKEDSAPPPPAEIYALRKELRETYKRCRNLGMYPYIEFSGNKGFHLWVFFEPLPCEIAYKAARYIVRDMAGGLDCIFPRQPELKNTRSGYGNLVRMPGNLHKSSNFPSLWLNPITLHPAVDQIFYFDTIKRTPREVLERTAQLYEPVMIESEDVTQIVKRNNYKVKLDHPLYAITKHKKRHQAQFHLVMKCIEAGMTDDEIEDAGRDWLDMYSNQYKSHPDDAWLDFKNCIDYCRSVYDKDNS